MSTPRTRRMTTLDAAFYYQERTGQLLHVAGIYTVAGGLDFEQLLAHLKARLHLIPQYTQRVVPVPFNLAHPTWEPDPHFDIRHHVRRHTLKPPGDDAQLSALASRLFAQPLDRNRPLWSLHQIDGYQGDRSVLFAAVHHCMIDGVSGVQLLQVLFDVTPEPQPVPPPEQTPDPPRLPSPTSQFLRAASEVARGIAGSAQSAWGLVRRPRRALAELAGAADAIAELGKVFLAPMPSTPFNGHVSILRRVVWVTFDLNDLKATKNRLGGTVNDVVLATISSALRRYLEAHGQNPDRMELRAMLPVNVRRPDEHLALGNRVSMLVAPLPVGIYDPLERLRQVRTATAQLKERGQASRMTRVMDLLDMLPPVLQQPLGFLQLQAAPINTVCTNIPGPPVSLYVQGKRLETLVPIIPLAQGVGLAFAILSYADTITIGVTSDPALVKDAERLCEGLREGFDELRTLAGIERPRRLTPVRTELQRRRESTENQVA